MLLVAIGWMYVVVMMAVAEAVHPNGTVLGAFITLLLYGVAPLAVVLYIMGTPGRRAARQAKNQIQSRANVAAVLLAAGAGSRMGHQAKGLLAFDGQPLVQRQVQVLREAGVGEVVVVLGHYADAVQAALLANPKPRMYAVCDTFNPTWGKRHRCGLVCKPSHRVCTVWCWRWLTNR